jgi:RNA 2',3'-cyclic 3'-phosphodiesterase
MSSDGLRWLPGMENLPLSPTARPHGHHLFFAVLADGAVAARAVRLRDQEMAARQMGGTKVRTERLHVTLASLGWDAEFSPRKVWWACAAAAEVRVPAFSLRFNRCLSFQGRQSRRPLVLCGSETGVAGMVALHQALRQALRAKAPSPAPASAGPSFTPHMTLLYGPLAVEEHGVEPLEWRVDAFQLLYNRRGSPGPYQVLGCWGLSRQPAAAGEDPPPRGGSDHLL